MASLWAKDRTTAALEEWVKTPGVHIQDIIAEALDRAEVYGFQRGFKIAEDLGANQDG